MVIITGKINPIRLVAGRQIGQHLAGALHRRGGKGAVRAIASAGLQAEGRIEYRV